MPRLSNNPYDQFSPAQQELRALAFAISSEKVPGARYVSGWDVTDPRPTDFAPAHAGYLTVDTLANLQAAAEQAEDPEAGWISVPSQRIIKRRERAAGRRKERDATSTWLGRGEEDVAPGTSLVESYNRRAEWVSRKDGSHELVLR
jgi:hypothetical protein